MSWWVKAVGQVMWMSKLEREEIKEVQRGVTAKLRQKKEDQNKTREIKLRADIRQEEARPEKTKRNQKKKQRNRPNQTSETEKEAKEHHARLLRNHGTRASNQTEEIERREQEAASPLREDMRSIPVNTCAGDDK